MAIELEPGGSSFLRNLLEEERRRVDGGAEERKKELSSFISAKESGLADDDKINEIYEIYENYVVSLPLWERPRPGPQTYRLYSEWEGDMRQELAAKRDELAKLEAQPVDKQLIINNARTRLLQLFEGAARDAGLLPPKPVRKTPEPRRIVENFSPVSTNSGEWMTFVELGKLKNVRAEIIKGSALRFPDGKEISVNSGIDLLVQTAEWLVREGLLTQSNCPFRLETMRSNYLIHSIPSHPSGQIFQSDKLLSNGLHLEGNWSAESITRLCGRLVADFSQDPAQFHIRLS